MESIPAESGPCKACEEKAQSFDLLTLRNKHFATQSIDPKGAQEIKLLANLWAPMQSRVEILS